MRKALVIGAAFAGLAATGIAIPVAADAAAPDASSKAVTHPTQVTTKHVTPLQAPSGHMAIPHVRHAAARRRPDLPIPAAHRRSARPRERDRAGCDAVRVRTQRDRVRAYALPSSSAGSGQIVAVTEAADNPNLESDLATYRAQYGLPACTTANGCFRKVNGSGQQGNYPPGDTGWGGEAALDVAMISAICPNCRILAVESTIPRRLVAPAAAGLRAVPRW